jgi:hypothetical protein
MYGVILRWLVGVHGWGVCVVVTVVATLSNFLNAFNLRKQLTLVGELKEITESSRSSTVACL